MKKIIAILLSCILGITLLVGCSESPTNNESGSQKQESETKDSIQEIKLKEPFVVKTENGEYSLTINSINATKKRNPYEEEQPKQVVLVDYSYQNKDFKGSDGQKLLIDNTAFVAMDGEGNVLRTYPSDIDKMPQLVPVGGKCTATIAYGIPSDSKTIKLQFERNNQPIGQLVTEFK